jgi:integrase
VRHAEIQCGIHSLTKPAGLCPSEKIINRKECGNKRKCNLTMKARAAGRNPGCHTLRAKAATFILNSGRDGMRHAEIQRGIHSLTKTVGLRPSEKIIYRKECGSKRKCTLTMKARAAGRNPGCHTLRAKAATFILNAGRDGMRHAEIQRGIHSMTKPASLCPSEKIIS